MFAPLIGSQTGAAPGASSAAGMGAVLVLPFGSAEQAFRLEHETGEISAALAGATCAAQGGQTVGTVTAGVGAATCAASGAVGAAGAVAASLASAAATGQGWHLFGSVAVTLAEAACEATGNAGAVSGPIAATLAAATSNSFGLAMLAVPTAFSGGASVSVASSRARVTLLEPKPSEVTLWPPSI